MVLKRDADGLLMALDRLSGEMTLVPPLPAQEIARRRLAAEHLRDWLSLSPFYAERALRARKQGGEMAEMEYWLDLQASCVNLSLPTLPTGSSKPAPMSDDGR